VSASEPVCVLCWKPLLVGDDIGHQVTGFEFERRQGGTNVIHLRRRTGNLAHRRCIEDGKTGTERMF